MTAQNLRLGIGFDSIGAFLAANCYAPQVRENLDVGDLLDDPGGVVLAALARWSAGMC
jgi:hypothetical protein